MNKKLRLLYYFIFHINCIAHYSLANEEGISPSFFLSQSETTFIAQFADTIAWSTFPQWHTYSQLKQVLKAGYNPNTKINNPLKQAIKHQNVKAVALLLQHNANPEQEINLCHGAPNIAILTVFAYAKHVKQKKNNAKNKKNFQLLLQRQRKNKSKKIDKQQPYESKPTRYVIRDIILKTIWEKDKTKKTPQPFLEDLILSLCEQTQSNTSTYMPSLQILAAIRLLIKQGANPMEPLLWHYLKNQSEHNKAARYFKEFFRKQQIRYTEDNITKKAQSIPFSKRRIFYRKLLKKHDMLGRYRIPLPTSHPRKKRRKKRPIFNPTSEQPQLMS